MPASIHTYSRAAASIALCVSALLAGCTVQVRPAAPAVYVPPPPPAPAVVAEAEAPGVAVNAQVAPPPLPDYEQPPIPAEGYLWTPGYWAWGGGGYYWVPGTWVQPPAVGLLWTPGYWGFVGGVYAFHGGYWGPHVGFYGGVNYGFGYTGVGFAGGRWVGGGFAYNRSVTNITNVTVVHNTYNETVINNNVTVNRVSFNGGAGGTAAVPTSQERVAMQEHHVAPTPLQQQHVQEASHNPALAAKANGGHPAIAATARPASFTGPGVVGAHGSTPTHSGAYPRGGQWNGGNAGQANANGGQANANGRGFVAGQPNAQHGGGQPNAQHAGGAAQPQAHKSQGGPKPQQKKPPAEKHEGDKR
jgi:hypothetical protein